MWCGLVHHVVNEHQWASGNGIIEGRCKHGPQMDEREKEWLEKGSKPHTEMCRIILDKKFLRNIPYFLQFRYNELELWMIGCLFPPNYSLPSLLQLSGKCMAKI